MARRFQIHFLELGLIGALLIYASSSAFVGLIGSAISLSYALFLLSIYMLLRSLAGRIAQWLPNFAFAAFAVLMIGEAIAQGLFGLHLNRFVLETLLQDDSFRFTGLSPVSATVAMGVVIVGLAGLSKVTEAHLLWKTDFSIAARKMLAVSLLFLGTAQAIYGTAYYFGASTVMPVKRHMPFWFAVHRNYSETLLTPIFGPRHENPFSLSEIDTQQPSHQSREGDSKTPRGLNRETPITNAPNILMVVADSVRANDIAADPNLMPIFNEVADKGFLSFNHNSVANCTHFSLYSMMTGRLPNGFGYARSRNALVGLLPDLIDAGYHATTTEGASLDWYDLADIIIPAEVRRTTFGSDNPLQNDRDATTATIETMKTWQTNPGTPKFHLTYYHSTHFPYGDDIVALGETNYERYRASLRLLDQELRRLFTAMDQLDAWQNTVVIVTSDHGEEFLENGSVGHGGQLTNYLIRVPFLVIGGGKAQQAAARDITSHLDIRPYINSLLQPETQSFTKPETGFLARCDYDHPNEFVVIDPSGTEYPFQYDDGYLHPVGQDISEKGVRDAALTLLERLREDAP